MIAIVYSFYYKFMTLISHRFISRFWVVLKPFYPLITNKSPQLADLLFDELLIAPIEP